MQASRCSPVSSIAQRVEVLRRLDGERHRAVLDPGPVPAGPHEVGRRPRTEPPRVAHGRAGQRRLVGAGRGEPVVVVGALGAVGRRARPERAAELQAGPEPVPVDAHEGVAEAVDAAVLLVARARAAADPGRLAGPGRVDVRRHARDQPVGEAGGAAGIVALRQMAHEGAERQARLARVGAADRVHDPVAVGHAATAPPSRRPRRSRAPSAAGRRARARRRCTSRV